MAAVLVYPPIWGIALCAILDLEMCSGVVGLGWVGTSYRGLCTKVAGVVAGNKAALRAGCNARTSTREH
jgi:hypothetical protein